MNNRMRSNGFFKEIRDDVGLLWDVCLDSNFKGGSSRPIS